MNKIQIFRLALIALVTSGVFFISFSHITAVASLYGNSGLTAAVYPICIDGVILISAFSLIGRRGITRQVKFYAQFGRWFGFSATIYANVAHSGYASTDAIIVNLIPAISLIITVELMIHAWASSKARSVRAATARSAGRHLKAVA